MNGPTLGWLNSVSSAILRSPFVSVGGQGLGRDGDAEEALALIEWKLVLLAYWL